MAHWIFQSRPGTGLEDRRCVKRYRNLITPGDDVAFWQTGGVGVVALGEVTGVPAFDDEAGWTVPITVLRTFAESPVSRAVLMADAGFAGSAILRMPGAASPFVVTDGEWGVIRRHAVDR